MTITPELFLAILSMDAYNRDYGAGIEGLGGEGSQIGTATLLKDSHILVDESGRRLDIRHLPAGGGRATPAYRLTIE